MRLRCLSKGVWAVLAVMKGDDECEMVDELQALYADKKTRATAAGFYVQFQRIPQFGPQHLGTDIFHNVDGKNEIYEFIKGSYRVLCFVADNRIVVCSHVVRKKRRTISPKDILRAATLRNDYFAARAANAVFIVED